jgi:hypothetical protein
MFPYTFVTSTSAVALTQLKGGQSCDFWGLCATSMEAAGAMFVKLWWGGNSNATPVLGTTLPTLTISIPTTGILAPMDWPIVYPGPLWVAVTKNNVGTDTTVLSTGGGVVTLFLE